MLGTFHYHGLIRKYIAVFGTLFNDITVKRIDNNDNIKEVIKVPLSYGPKQKFINRIVQNPNIEKGVAIQLPRMGFDMTNMQYNPDRKLNSLNQKVVNYQGNLGRVYSPVPYDLTFNLYIMVRYSTDGAMIVEQILPAFKPDFTVTINALPTMDIKIDMPIVLNGVQVEDSYDGDFLTRRAIIYTLDFTAKCYFYPNIKGEGFGDFSEEANVKLIRTTITNFHLLTSGQAATLTSPILLETSNEGNDNAILLETGTDKLLNEVSTRGLDKSRVLTAIKDTVSDSFNPNDLIDSTSIINEKQFFAEGREYNPETGTYDDGDEQ